MNDNKTKTQSVDDAAKLLRENEQAPAHMAIVLREDGRMEYVGGFQELESGPASAPAHLFAALGSAVGEEWGVGRDMALKVMAEEYVRADRGDAG